jgi:hypothetical protein
MQYERGEFNLDAPYQRGHVWTPEQKALLIDSFIGGLGVPPLYLRHHDAGSEGPWREVVDGKQCLTALMEFMDGCFPYQGYTFNEWTGGDRRRFSNMGLSIFVVHDLTDEEAWEVFRRVNFCGVPQDQAAFEARKNER